MAWPFWLHSHTWTQFGQTVYDAKRCIWARCEKWGIPPAQFVCAVRRQWNTSTQRRYTQRRGKCPWTLAMIGWKRKVPSARVRARQTRSVRVAANAVAAGCYDCLPVAALRLFSRSPLLLTVWFCFVLDCWSENVLGRSHIVQSYTIHGNAFASMHSRGLRFIWRVCRTFPLIIKIRYRCDRKTRTHMQGTHSLIVEHGKKKNIQNIYRQMHRVSALLYYNTWLYGSRYGRIAATIKMPRSRALRYFSAVLRVSGGRSRVPLPLAPLLHMRTHITSV